MFHSLKEAIKKSKLVAFGKTESTNVTQEEIEPIPSPASHYQRRLPDIQIESEENSAGYSQFAPLQCMTCSLLTGCTQQPVRKGDLLRSAENGCSICDLFLKACLQRISTDQFDYLLSWTSDRGIFGLQLSKDEPEEMDEANVLMTPVVAVIFLALNGSKLSLAGLLYNNVNRIKKETALHFLGFRCLPIRLLSEVKYEILTSFPRGSTIAMKIIILVGNLLPPNFPHELLTSEVLQRSLSS
jgi:hypothetical protein